MRPNGLRKAKRWTGKKGALSFYFWEAFIFWRQKGTCKHFRGLATEEDLTTGAATRGTRVDILIAN